ncbi:MAG: FkbM family methyltransferase [Pseudomonadota bacterium]
MSDTIAFEATKALHPYYRDTLSRTFSFPDVGTVPHDLVKWAISSTTTNLAALDHHLAALGPSGLSPNDDRALRVMLRLIVLTNAVLRRNNPQDVPLPAATVQQVKAGLNEVLSLSPNRAYMENTALLLLRLNEIDEMMGFIAANMAVLSGSLVVRHVVGFVEAIEGNHAAVLPLLEPLAAQPEQFAFADLCMMGAQYHLDQWPQAPVRFESVKQRQTAVDASSLPELQMLRRVQATGRPIVLVACDSGYFFQHALPLAHSLAQTNADQLSLHLHLYSPTASVLAEIEALVARCPGIDLGVSWEAMPAAYDTRAVIYYSCIRFVRMYQLMGIYQNDLCMLDADGLLKGRWDAFCAQMGMGKATDIALLYDEKGPFWEKVVALFFYARHSELGREFVGQVAAFILDNFAHGTTRWFLDQIALGVVYERWFKPCASVLPLRLATTVDFKHGPDSFLWVVTNNKDASPRYNDYRAALGREYGMLPSLSPAALYTLLSERQKVFFLQVGVMDGASYDPIFPYVKQYGWQGILVEPLPDMIAKAQQHYGGQAGLVFENVAITQQAETRVLYRIRPEAAQAGNLPHWVLGMSSFMMDKLADYRTHVVEEAVACLPLAALLAKHQPARIDVLQIDTEGYDFRIFEQFDFAAYRPAIINLEYVNLAAAEKASLEAMLLAQGYLFYRHELDLFAVERAIAFPAG